MQGSPHCARPGCGGGVAAWLTYDYKVRTVWLDDLGGDFEGDRWALCATHASGLRVPRGWACRDRRPGQQPGPGLARLFAPEGPDAPSGGPGPTPAHRAIAV